MTGSSITEIARSWIGTPYLHQASLKQAGADCLGLIRGVWREAIADEPEEIPAYTQDWSEPAMREDLLAAARRWLVETPLATESPGDVLLFRMRENAVAKHLGIVTETGPTASFIHAYSGHGVVETRLTDPWRRKIVARFQFPKGA
jgi:NlpC/P60 family putative phage cell wall peptidase